MIVYDLQCASGHRFEGWFEDGDAYTAQKEEGLISCPVCNDLKVLKVPSSFAIRASSSTSRPLPADPEGIGRAVSEYLEKNFDNVGCNFAQEALKMHYGVSDRKNIRGTSTKEEEKMLEKEGVPFFKVPSPTAGDPET